jgi:hypothetical protein
MDFVTGSVAAVTFQEQLEALASRLGAPASLVVAGFHSFLTIGGAQCRNLAADSFGRVDLDPAGTAHIQLKGVDGLPVRNANPLDPANTGDCSWTSP